MNILYAVQATGNGHISRAMELLPFLHNYGNVDLFLSGANSTLALDAPIKYRSKGLSLFYTCNGKLNYRKMMPYLSPARIWKEVRDLPVEKYDLILNDFECITAMACAHKKVPSVNFGHQASFMSNKTPRPEKQSRIGEWILKNYARADQYVGLHFDSYDDFIMSPVIKASIRKAEAVNKGHFTVYLPSYCDAVLEKHFLPLKEGRFEIFSHEKKQPETKANIRFIPVEKEAFNQSLIQCEGIITGGGFETPAEALYLKKKMICIPIRGQYEQQCNAAALKKLGVTVLDKLDDDFGDHMQSWMQSSHTPTVHYKHDTESIVHTVMMRSTNIGQHLHIPYPDLIFN